MTDVIHILSLAKHFGACGIERSIFVWNQINSLCQSFHNKTYFKLSGVIFVATLSGGILNIVLFCQAQLSFQLTSQGITKSLLKCKTKIALMSFLTIPLSI